MAKPVEPALVEQWAKLKRQGWAYNQIARAYGAYPSTVKRCLSRVGFRKQRHFAYPAELREEAKRLYLETDLNKDEVAQRLGVSRWILRGVQKPYVPHKAKTKTTTKPDKSAPLVWDMRGLKTVRVVYWANPCREELHIPQNCNCIDPLTGSYKPDPLRDYCINCPRGPFHSAHCFWSKP